MKLTDVNLPRYDEGWSASGVTILVGMFHDGLIGKPFSLPEERLPISYLGESPATLMAQTLLDSGVPAEDIFYYRLNGERSSLQFYEDENEDTLLFELMSIGASEEDNNLLCVISEEGLTLQSNYEDKEAKASFLRTYRYADYPYLIDLASAINQDALLGLIDLTAKSHKTALSATCFINEETPNPRTESLLGADSEEGHVHLDALPDELLETWEADYFQLFATHILGEGYDGESYQEIMQVPAEVIAFPDLAIDTSPTIASLAATIALQKTNDQLAHCYALFQASPPPERTRIREGEYLNDDGTYWNSDLEETLLFEPEKEQRDYVERLLSLYSDDEREEVYMNHLLVVVGQRIDEVKASGASSFLAGLLLTPAGEPLSNQSLPLFDQLSVTLPQTMVASLSRKGYICIVPSIRRGPVPQLVQTLQFNDNTILSDWSNQRLLGIIREGLSQLLDRYIGKSFSIFSAGAIENDIADFIDGLPGAGRLTHFEVGKIEQFAQRGEADIPITLYLPQDVRGIQGILQMSQEGWQVNLWNMND